MCAFIAEGVRLIGVMVMAVAATVIGCDWRELEGWERRGWALNTEQVSEEAATSKAYRFWSERV